MIDPANATNVVVQLTAQQISDAIEGTIIKLVISIFLTALGIISAKISDQVGKFIGTILSIIGAMGTIYFALSLMNLLL